MAEFCDRTPCARFLRALGVWVSGARNLETGKCFFVVFPPDSAEDGTGEPIEYCPFCGTRLDNVPMAIVNKYLPRVRKKRSLKRAKSVS